MILTVLLVYFTVGFVFLISLGLAARRPMPQPATQHVPLDVGIAASPRVVSLPRPQYFALPNDRDHSSRAA